MTANDLVNKIHRSETVEVVDGLDRWTFDRSHFRKIKVMSKVFHVLAKNNEGQFLCIPSDETLTVNSKFYVIEDDTYFFHAMSLSEMLNKEDVQNITKQISSNEIKAYDTYVNRYRDCPGSLYWIACALMTSEYDDHYSKSRNNKAFKLFKSLAPHGDPRVCKELADYFLFTKNDIEESLKWRKQSIDNGNVQDLREYADSIIDDAPAHIHDALQALHQMQDLNINPGWAYWKEGFIYMKGLGVEKDFKKGFHLTEKAHLLGHPVAKSDLAFFYYQGMGTEKDLHKALELLEEANKISREKNARLKADSEDQEDVEGDYESQIAFIKTELKKDLR